MHEAVVNPYHGKSWNVKLRNLVQGLEQFAYRSVTVLQFAALLKETKNSFFQHNLWR